MSRVRGSIVIDRPVEEVFAAVADQTNEPHYNPAVTASRQVTDGPVGVGTHFRATVLSRGRPTEVDIEVTRFEPPRLLASRSVMAGSTAVGQLHLEPIGGGTRFSWTGRSPWPDRLGSSGPSSPSSADVRSGPSGPGSTNSWRTAGARRPTREGAVTVGETEAGPTCAGDARRRMRPRRTAPASWLAPNSR